MEIKTIRAYELKKDNITMSGQSKGTTHVLQNYPGKTKKETKTQQLYERAKTDFYYNI